MRRSLQLNHLRYKRYVFCFWNSIALRGIDSGYIHEIYNNEHLSSIFLYVCLNLCKMLVAPLRQMPSNTLSKKYGTNYKELVTGPSSRTIFVVSIFGLQ